MKEKIIVSACLLGHPCRYDGKSKPVEGVIRLKEDFELIPTCPEELGGLKTPRLPCEIAGEAVIRSDGKDMTANYRKGAERVLHIARENSVKFAILKENSPSCGTKRRYDGTFSGKLISKPGITAELLKENGFSVLSEEEIEKAR